MAWLRYRPAKQNRCVDWRNDKLHVDHLVTGAKARMRSRVVVNGALALSYD